MVTLNGEMTMAYEHHKSGVTILFDVIRNALVLIATGFLVFLIGKWHWIAAVLAAIPVYVVMLNLFGFLTLPLYMLTPEKKLMAKAHGCLTKKEAGFRILL